jgi:hypothetical protein
MAREGVSPVEIASPPAAEREARDADPAAGREPSSTASPVGSEVRAPPEAEERAAPRADHERERVDEGDERPEADWDDVLERLARLDRDLDTFVARRNDGDARFATLASETPTETRDDFEPPLPAGRATALDTNATERERESIERERERESIEREREREPAAASRAFVARLAASMTSSLEGDASAEETRAARAEAVAAVEAFYDALLRTRPEKQERHEQQERHERHERHERALSMRRALEMAGENVFAKTSRVDDSVANLRRVLETL